MAGLNELKGGVAMKRKSIGKRIALALAAIAIGCVVWIIWGLILPPTELVDKLLHTAAGLAVMGYLIYRWSIKG